MSFTKRVREECAQYQEKKKCCQKAEILGITLAGDALLGGEWVFFSENEAKKKHIAALFKWAFSLRESVIIDEKCIYIDHPGDTLGVLSDLSLLGRVEASAEIIQKDCCKRAFTRGVFQVAGHISDPEKEYRMEFVLKSHALCRMLCEALEAYEVHPKIAVRGEKYVVYLKKSEEIADVLKMMSANQSVWAFLDAKIQKKQVNYANRQYNCDLANTNKTIKSSEEQRAVIEYLQAEGRLSSLPEKLREMAKMRMENPDASMAELGEIMGISKGAVANRLRKIMEYKEGS